MNKEQKTSQTTEPAIAVKPMLAPVFTKEDLWDAWWQSAIKTCSFTGVDKEYERRCFERFYDNKLASIK